MAVNDLNPTRTQREATEGEAARLVILLESSDDPAIRAQVHGWINADPRHAVAYATAHQAWRDSARVRLRSTDKDVVDESADAEEAPAGAPLWTRRGFAVGGLAVAASALGLVGMGMWAGWFQDRHTTSHGEQGVARLADGSSISLNGDTMLDVSLSERQRNVRLLRGEAMFDIARDETRPFIVDLGDARVRVLGTKFNIRRRDELTELAVTEGVVAVAVPGAAAVEVRAGDSALIRPGGPTTLVSDPILVQHRIAWTKGFVEFDEQPLKDVISEFNRYSRTQMVIGDPRIDNVIITGRFGISESQEFISALESSFEIVAQPSGDGALILTQGDGTTAKS